MKDPLSLQESEVYIDVKGARLAVQTWGMGSPLICLHGGMGIDASYLKVPGIVGLANEEQQVVIFDQRGHGASTAVSDETCTLAQWAEDVDSLASALQQDTFALMGHSYGGFIALTAAIRNPERIRQLVLVGTSAGPVSFHAPKLSTAAEVEAFFASRWPHFFVGQEKHWAVFRQVRFSPRAFQSAFHVELSAYDVRSQVSTLTMPVLLVVGEQDGYLAGMRWLHEHLPDSRLAIIPGAGHLPFIEKPDAFREIVSDFLGSAAKEERR